MVTNQDWGYAYLQRCGIDPENPADVRSAYEVCRETHVQWLLEGAGDMDRETFGSLVEAILSVNGWSRLPLDWPAPILVVLPPEGLQNLLPRTKPSEADPRDRLPRRRNPRIGCEEYASGTWIHGNPHDCPRSARC